MKNFKGTKRAFVGSVVSTALCVTMLFGTTFAWFTDTASSKENKIQAGTLAVDLYEYDDENLEYVCISEDESPIFDYDKWEPGYSDAHILKIKNQGDLALQWKLTLTEQSASTASDDSDTSKGNLADVIDVYVKEGAEEIPEKFADLEKEGFEKLGTLSDVMGSTKGIAYGTLAPEENDEDGEDFVAIVLHMQETASNNYQGASVGDGFDVYLLATQWSYEADSFGDSYDEFASFEDVQIILTQTEKYGILVSRTGLTDDELEEQYSDFLDVSEPFALTPGLEENIAPQGMDVCDETGNIYMSGYFKTVAANPFVEDKTATAGPTVIAVMDEEGTLIAEYVMYEEDGSPLTSHMGGVAVSDDTLFFSYNQGTDENGGLTYFLATIPLDRLPTSGHYDVRLSNSGIYQLPIQPSYLNYSNGTLWVGNFYNANKTYPAPTCLGTTDGHGSYLLGYEMESGTERLEKAEGHQFAMPDVMYVLEDKQYQGGVVLDDGRIVLSRSYGRNNDSYIRVFNPSNDAAYTTTVDLDGQDYQVPVLAGACKEKEVKIIPLSEGICMNPSGGDTDILILLESGSIVYADGRVGSDYIWSMTIGD